MRWPWSEHRWPAHIQALLDAKDQAIRLQQEHITWLRSQVEARASHQATLERVGQGLPEKPRGVRQPEDPAQLEVRKICAKFEQSGERLYNEARAENLNKGIPWEVILTRMQDQLSAQLRALGIEVDEEEGEEDGRRRNAAG